MVYEFKFPDVGEGIMEGEIVKWLVKEGDKVKENDNVVKIETDKAVVDIPSPRTGKVLKLNVKEGDTIKVGETLMTIDDGQPSLKQPFEKALAEKDVGEEKIEKPKEKPKVCIPGQPCEEEGEPLSTPQSVSTLPKKEKRKSVSVVGELEEASDEEELSLKKKPRKEKTGLEDHVLAVPRVRALAKKLNVDISKVKGSGESGRVTDDDVIAASKGSVLTKEVKGIVQAESKIKIAKKYDMWGYVDHVPLKGVRKTIAKHMVAAFSNVVPVTAMIDIDVTKLWDFREKEKVKTEKKGVKLTFFPFIIRAVIEGLKKHPYLNSEMHGDEIILKKYYNIGMAVDTEVGLMVPVIKRAETKSLYDIAKEIVDLAKRANERKLDIMDFKGGSFTITNYGSIGGNYGTPMINYPEAAILGVGRIFDSVVLLDGKVENRKVLPLSLTFDHRILDGAEAARFLNVVKEYLEEPSKIKFEGDKE